MKKAGVLIYGLLISLALGAQRPYAVQAISPALLTNASVVKRMEEISYEMKNLRQASYTYRFAHTILNEAGQKQAMLTVAYDRFRKVRKIEGALFDAEGHLLKKLSRKDLRDHSAINEISLYDDNRVKVHDFNHRTYPYTVVYEVEMAFNNTFFMPQWKPQPVENMAVEKSSCTFVVPDDYVIRYKALNVSGNPVITTDNGRKRIYWELRGLSALSRPFASPRWSELTPVVLFAPTGFEIDGYRGDASTWQLLGNFQWQLNQGRDQLPPAILQKVAALTAGISSPREKVKRLYAFMQQTTRYISVQRGIGGLQPFEANDVAEKGYGDCKALTNYMQSLLKAAGIPSYYTLVRGGYENDDRFLPEDFPYDVFNHVVLCVPMQKDTMWLECTSQTDPAGYTGGFIANRKALVITGNGGKLCSTPRYSTEDNFQLRRLTGFVNEKGDVELKLASLYGGLKQDEYRSQVNRIAKEETQSQLQQKLGLSSIHILGVSYRSREGNVHQVEEALHLQLAGYASVSGRRLFLLPNIFSRQQEPPADTAGRVQDVVIEDGYTETDTVRLRLPEGYALESLQTEVNLQTRFGTYERRVIVDDTIVTYHRKLVRFAGRFPANEGKTLAEFLHTVYTTDRTQLVFVKKNEMITGAGRNKQEY